MSGDDYAEEAAAAVYHEMARDDLMDAKDLLSEALRYLPTGPRTIARADVQLKWRIKDWLER